MDIGGDFYDMSCLNPDITESLDALVRLLAQADDRELANLPGLMDTLFRTSRPAGRHRDDIALLLLRAATPSPPGPDT